MDGYPLPPLNLMKGESQEQARSNASNYNSDMRFMVWEGQYDYIFQPEPTFASFTGMFQALGIPDVLKIRHEEPGMSHWIQKNEFQQMWRFINDGLNHDDLATN